MSPLLIGIAVYVALQLLIVFAIARKVRGENDYLLAGRRFGPGLATFMIFATWFGAETCIGAAGAVYEGGLSASVADPFGYSICLFLMGLVFAAPLWRRKLTTFADLFRQRYSPGVERLAALLLVPTSIMWAAAQIRALGQVISASSTFDVELAIALAAGVVVIYTVYGGLMADAIADLIQGVMVMVGLVVVLFVVVNAAGGWDAALDKIDPEKLRLFGAPGESPLAMLEKWAVPITGSVVAQELVAVILASRSPQVAQRAALTGGALYFTFGLIPIFIGLVGATLIPGLSNPEQILPEIAQRHLSTLPYILFVGAVVSAILSTVASALLAAAAITSHNLVAPLHPSLSDRARLRTARIAVVVAGVLAWLLARHAESIYALVEQSSAFGGAGIFVIVVFGLFTRVGSAHAATAALVTGIATWLLGEHVWHWPVPYLTSLAVAFGSYLLMVVLERGLPNHTREAQ